MARKQAVAIVPADSGFGEWVQEPRSYRKVTSVNNAAHVYSGGLTGEAISVEDLPDEKNISGRIQNEPSRVYAVEDEYGDYIYFGIQD